MSYRLFSKFINGPALDLNWYNLKLAIPLLSDVKLVHFIILI